MKGIKKNVILVIVIIIGVVGCKGTTNDESLIGSATEVIYEPISIRHLSKEEVFKKVKQFYEKNEVVNLESISTYQVVSIEDIRAKLLDIFDIKSTFYYVNNLMLSPSIVPKTIYFDDGTHISAEGVSVVYSDINKRIYEADIDTLSKLEIAMRERRPYQFTLVGYEVLKPIKEVAYTISMFLPQITNYKVTDVGTTVMSDIGVIKLVKIKGNEVVVNVPVKEGYSINVFGLKDNKKISAYSVVSGGITFAQQKEGGVVQVERRTPSFFFSEELSSIVIQVIEDKFQRVDFEILM